MSPQQADTDRLSQPQSDIRPPRRLLSSTRPVVELDTTPPAPAPTLHHSPQVQAHLGADGALRLSGPAGSGVSSTLVDAALARIKAGVHPDNIVILTGSKESAGRLRRMLTRRLVGQHYASAASMVRSVHSFAFSLVWDYATYQGEPAPRLLTGAEHDAMIREILAGTVSDGGAYWPPRIQPALPLVGFARALRDFILRAEERGLTPDQLREWGHTYDRDLWVAAGDFLEEYRQIVRLSDRHQLNASELTSRALDALNDPASPQFRQRILNSVDTLLVDDAQNLDPMAAELVEIFRTHARSSIIAGDEKQAVFRFRGADPRYFASLEVAEGHDLLLGASHRNPALTAVVTCARASTQPALVADFLRRSHLIEGNAWADHVVICREAGAIPAIKRALLAAGVPVHQDATDMVLAEQPLITQLVLAITGALRPLSPQELESLVLGPVGGADPVTLRRLIRGVRQAEMSRGGTRRSLDILTELLSPSPVTPTPGTEVNTADGETMSLRDVEAWRKKRQDDITAALVNLTDAERRIFDRIDGVLSAGREAIARRDSVEHILWAVWQATGLDDHLSAVALRGGARGSQADTALDAVMNLFDFAGDFAERRPTAGISSFLAAIAEQQLPTAVRDRRSTTPDAVSILTAHGVAGQQWPHVIIAGVQEDSWPTIGETGTLFGQEELVDLAGDGIDPRQPISRAGERLAEEQRLFDMALTRATASVIVTTVDSPDEAQLVPSRFLENLGDDYLRVNGEDLLAGAAAHLIGGETTTETPEASPNPQGTDDGEEVDSPQGDTPPTLVTLGDPAGQRRAEHDTLVETTEQLIAPSPLLNVATMIADLRRLAGDDSSPNQAEQAARQLARLAHAGLHTAHPDYWWGELPPSTTTPLVPVEQPVRLSPSQVENIRTCPARTVITRMLAQPIGDTVNLQRGTLVHAAAEALAAGVNLEALRQLIHDVYDTVLNPPGQPAKPTWETKRLHDTLDTVLANTAAWISGRGSVVDNVDTEATVSVNLNIDEAALHATHHPDANDGTQHPDAQHKQKVRISGRADRIEHYSDGLRIIDIKTGRPATVKDAEHNLQLATYQVALSHATRYPDGSYRESGPTTQHGSDKHTEPVTPVAGAQLVYVAQSNQKTIVAQRNQPALDPEQRAAVELILARAARMVRGPSVLAQPNPQCASCQLKTLCPTTAEGKATTNA